MSKARRFIVLIAIALTSIILTGCGLTDPYKPQSNNGRGQTAATVESHIESLPGIEDAEFTYEDWYQDGEGGLFSSGGMNFLLDVTVADGYYIANPTAFLWFITKEAWTANENSPKGSLSVTITGGISDNYVWDKSIVPVFGAMQGQVSFWHGDEHDYESEDREALAPGEYLPVHIGIADDAMRDTFGDWPGELVTYDASESVAQGEIPEVTPSALTETELSRVGLGNEYYVKYVGARNEYNGILYKGEFVVTFYYDGKEAGKVTHNHKDSYSAYSDTEDMPTHFSVDLYTGDKMPDLSHYTYTVEFEEQEGFDTSDISSF